ncbi:MAG TPA: hypothetical protein VGR56_05900 [Nitrososphaerales archaeon]|nr:hypothetical protein [Nitrososphaerales archaeon]
MKFRIDFGRVFPGLVILFAGFVLLAVLALVAVVAFLFSFLLGAAVLGVTLELMLIPAVLIAAGVVTTLTGVSWWGIGGDGWFSRIVRKRAKGDGLGLGARVGELIGVAISLIIFLFLYENQVRGVAFFTSTFDGTAQFFFYAPLFTGMALSFARAVYGHRNGVRPFDSFNALFLTAAAFWLLSVFPFDFTHLGDMFPASIQFLFGWIGNWVGQVLFILAGVASLINFMYTGVLYGSVRSQLMAIKGRMP